MNGTAPLRTAVLTAIDAHASQRPDAIALESPTAQLSYRQLQQAVAELAQLLMDSGTRTLGLLADNGPAWALVDLAAMAAAVRIVPLPPFFSQQQIVHALGSAGVDIVIADPRLPFPQGIVVLDRAPLTALPSVVGSLLRLTLARDEHADDALPSGTQKITYTSGTTGEPKGVCLSQATMDAVAASLCEASGAAAGDRHLAVLPLPTLLENIGGLYAPLLAGATACLWPLQTVGLSGASGLDTRALISALSAARATSAILVPQMLQAVVEGIEAGLPAPTQLKFVAVGGASVAPRLLQRAQALGLPVFEGYGLSECASVVALNRAGLQRAGSVGKPLPHLRVRIAADGEIEVCGNALLGYVGEAPFTADRWLGTGDIGHLDRDGFLYLSGRKKNMFVTAFGRNVAPEWVERELCLQPAIAQAAVFGEARPWNVAVVVPRRGADASAVDAAIAAVNRDLPDYARLRRWLPAHAAFTPANELLTANGRLRRTRIAALYAEAIDVLYEETQHEFS